MSFVVPGVPVSQPRQRHATRATKNGRVYHSAYTPTEHPVNAYKAMVQLACRTAYQGPPMDGPVKLGVVFVLPRPRSKMWKRKPMPREPHVGGNADLDNILKATMDSLTSLCWRNDGQVWQVTTAKYVAAGDEQPHAEVTITWEDGDG